MHQFRPEAIVEFQMEALRDKGLSTPTRYGIISRKLQALLFHSTARATLSLLCILLLRRVAQYGLPGAAPKAVSGQLAVKSDMPTRKGVLHVITGIGVTNASRR